MNPGQNAAPEMMTDRPVPMDSMDEDMVWLLLEIRVSLQAVNYSGPVIARRSQ
jgi:hypothetical protein